MTNVLPVFPPDDWRGEIDRPQKVGWAPAVIGVVASFFAVIPLALGISHVADTVFGPVAAMVTGLGVLFAPLPVGIFLMTRRSFAARGWGRLLTCTAVFPMVLLVFYVLPLLLR